MEWSDFTGKVDKKSPFAAQTVSHLSGNPGKVDFIGDSVRFTNYEITLELEPELSWAKKNQITDELLVHEQGHFDLNILCMQEILSVVKEKMFKRSTYQVDIQNTFYEIKRKYSQIAIRYDEVTNHSRNREEQLKWDKFFETTLSNWR